MCRNDSLSKLQGTLRGLTDMLNWVRTVLSFVRTLQQLLQGDELLHVNHTKWPKTLPVSPFFSGRKDSVLIVLFLEILFVHGSGDQVRALP
jgi:hypothetical protein